MKTRSLKAILCGAANPNVPGAGGRTPLHRAAREGRVEDLKVLLENGGDVHLGDETGEQPLQMAARKGQLDCVRLLLRAGADVNHIPPPEKSEYSESALCSVARKGRKAEAFEILLELLRAGAAPNAASSAKRYPLHAAAGGGQVEMVRALLSAGAKADVFDHTGRLPLHRALNGESGNPAVVPLLLQAGADSDVRDQKGTPAVFYAINGIKHSASLLRALLAGHPDLSVTDPVWKRQPLALALDQDLDEIVSLLRDAGAPEPKAKPEGAEESEGEKETEDDETVELEDAFERSDALEGEEQDDYGKRSPELEAAVDEVVANAALLPLRSPFGWRASRAHWALLSAAHAPNTLIRLAYVARGCLNRPVGKELEDGPAVLGESYLSAVERFLSLGLFAITQPAEAVASAATIRQLKDLATAEGVKVGAGTKSVIINALLCKLRGEDLVARLKIPTHYQLTVKGDELAANRATHVQSILRDLAAHLREQISKSDLRAVLNTLTLVTPFIQYWNIQQAAASIRSNLRRIREIMDAKLPTTFPVSAEEAPLWKTWAALYSFCSLSKWPSPTWLEIPQLCVERNMTPSDVFRAHFPQYHF